MVQCLFWNLITWETIVLLIDSLFWIKGNSSADIIQDMPLKARGRSCEFNLVDSLMARSVDITEQECKKPILLPLEKFSSSCGEEEGEIFEDGSNTAQSQQPQAIVSQTLVDGLKFSAEARIILQKLSLFFCFCISRTTHILVLLRKEVFSFILQSCMIIRRGKEIAILKSFVISILRAILRIRKQWKLCLR